MNDINRFAVLEINRIAGELIKKGKTDWKSVSDAARALVYAKKYEYIITPGGRPEGEGWEKSPHSDNPNSWRREVGKGHAVMPTTERPAHPRPEFPRVPYSQVPFDTKEAMDNALMMSDDVDAYMRYLSDDDTMSDTVSDMVGMDYLHTNTAENVARFGDDGYEKGNKVRQHLSSVACKLFNVPPDGYSITEAEDIDEDELNEARVFTKAAQIMASMCGLVDEDGYITAYRGTNDQYKDGKYSGSNCESWAVSPQKMFPEKHIIRAKIPLERVIGCFAGNNGLYICDETEITCCTNDLDFEFEDLMEGMEEPRDASEDVKNFIKLRDSELAKTNERIKHNVHRMMEGK